MNTHSIKTTILTVALLGTARLGWAGDSAPPPTWETKPEVAGILMHVPPLKHPLPKGWQPTLFWEQAPLSFDKPAKLKKELRALQARGISPCIDLWAEYATLPGCAAVPESVAKSIAQAKAVAKAGFPVQLAMKGALDLYRLPDGKIVRHADSPDGDKFPCLLLQAGWQARAGYMRGLLKKFAEAKVPVAGVWYDYEGHPNIWNGMMEHIQRCPSCQKQFKEIPSLQKAQKDLPPLSDGFDLWVAWSANFGTEAVAESFAKPVREVFPAARIGDFGFVPSSAACPIAGSSVNPAELDVAQPVCYAMPSGFAGCAYFHPRDIDQAYFLGLLGAVTGVAKNLRPNQMMMPYVCSFCDGNESVPRMSRSFYREFLRHAILRGARGFYCFNIAPPSAPAADYYSELADINVVYNELFAYRDFLEGGETLNHDWVTLLTPTTAKEDWRQPGNTNTWSRGGIVDDIRIWLPTPKVKDASIWSGIRKGDKALIRVVTLGETPTFLNVSPFPGRTVRLLASPAGTTYLVARTGATECVD